MFVLALSGLPPTICVLKNKQLDYEQAREDQASVQKVVNLAACQCSCIALDDR